MFELFGQPVDTASRESLVNIAGLILGIGELLIAKGICTDDEISAAMTRGQQKLDQFAAHKREQSLAELKADHPELHKGLRLLSEILTGEELQ